MADSGSENSSENICIPKGLAVLIGLLSFVGAITLLLNRRPIRPDFASHYIPPDVQIGGNGIPQPNQIISITFTPDQLLIAGMEVNGEGAYQMLVNGTWGAVIKLPPAFQFTFGGSNSATRTIPAGNWTQLKVIVSSSLKQNGVVTQNDVFTYTYTA